MERTTAVLMLTHRFDRDRLRAFDRLRRQGPRDWHYFVLHQDVGGPPPDLGGRPAHRFALETLLERGYLPLASSLVPGSTHYGVLDFALKHPDIQQVWQVEYDVYFNGDWSRFFGQFDDRADLLTSHIRAFADEPDWPWWPMNHPTETIPEHRLRAFHPIFRLSRRAIERLDEQYRSGWRGHYETTVPTLLHAAGMEIEELGGSGPFVCPGQPGPLLHGQPTWRQGEDERHDALPPALAAALVQGEHAVPPGQGLTQARQPMGADPDTGRDSDDRESRASVRGTADALRAASSSVNRRQYRTRSEARTDVFDYIERFHNPRKIRKIERLRKEEVGLTQPSVKKG